MTDHVTYKFVERTVVDLGDSFDVSKQEFLVSTRQLQAKAEELSWELRYVTSLLDRAKAGSRDLGDVSPKFSFGDCSDWYTPLEPVGEGLADPVVEVHYDVRSGW
jgi:hypothetical protein